MKNDLWDESMVVSDNKNGEVGVHFVDKKGKLW